MRAYISPRILLSAWLTAAALSSNLVAADLPSSQIITSKQAQKAQVNVETASKALQQALRNSDTETASQQAAYRRDALIDLIKLDPDSAAAQLLDESQAEIAKSAVGNSIEQWLHDTPANISVYYFDNIEKGTADVEHWATVDGKKLRLYSPDSLHSLSNGQQVRIGKAAKVGDVLLSVSSIKQDTIGAIQAKANRYTNAKIAMILVNFTNNTAQPWTPSEMSTAMSNTVKWFDEVSFGKQTTTFNMFGWYPLALDTSTGCPYQDIETKGIAAATQAGVDLSGYNIVAFAFPDIPGCDWAGLGGGGNFWLNNYNSVSLIAHEVGHVLGLGHANSRNCSNGDYTQDTGCTREEYGSPFDVMGRSSGHYHPGAKRRLDYLGDPATTQGFLPVTKSGEYEITVYAASNVGVKALSVPRFGSEDLHIEYRRAINADSRLGNRVGNKVQITHGTNTAIDLNPATADIADAALDLGKTYDEVGSGIKVTVISTDENKARVKVELDPCGRSTPAMQIVDTSPSALSGESKTFRVYVSNMDNSPACANATTFKLDAIADANVTLPAFRFSPGNELTLAPGASGSVELTFDLPAGTTNAITYNLDSANKTRPLYKARQRQSFTPKRARLAVVAGDAQSTRTSSAFPQPLRVKLTDAAGAAVAGEVVSFSAPSGNASAGLGSSGRCTTDNTGECTVSASARTLPANYSVRATSTVAVNEIYFKLTNTAASGTPSDTTPDAINFTAVNGVGLGVPITSTTARVTGIDTAAPVSVTDGEYSIGCNGTFTAAAGQILANQSVCVRHTSARTGASSVSTELKIGTVTATFVSTTAAGGGGTPSVDTTPDAFRFASRFNVFRATPVTSDPATITGIDSPTPISITGGSYSIGCTSDYVTTAGTIQNGQRVCVRHTSAAAASTDTVSTLSIGGVSASFTSNTTGAAPTTIDQFDLSGNWFEPETSGQGLVAEIYTGASRGPGSPPYFFAGWFTYTDTAGGVSEQDWFTLESQNNNSTTTFNLVIAKPSPGNLDAGPVTSPPRIVGNATLTFSSCTDAVLDYTFNASDGGKTGQIRLRRLLNDVSCKTASRPTTTPRNFFNSGAFFEPVTAGQGLFFEINPIDKFFFGAWYTYSAAGGDYRWFTLQKGGIDPNAITFDAVPIVESTGGRFDLPGEPTNRQVGEASLRVVNCTQSVFTYRFTAGENNGRTGEIPLTRVGPKPAECTP